MSQSATSNFNLFFDTQNELKTKFSNLYTTYNYENLKNEYSTQENFNINFTVDNIELSALHINIQSLNSKMMEFRDYIENFKINFDVIILTEVWSTNIDFFHNLIPGYQFIYQLPKKSIVGGVAMYVNNTCSFQICDNISLPEIESNKIENLWIELEKNKSKFIIGGLYRHPNGNINKFCEGFEQSLTKLTGMNKTALIFGDFNINFLHHDSNKDISNYLQTLFLNNVCPVLLLPTRITASTKTLIDHIYYFEPNQTKAKAYETLSGNLLSDLSDHLPNYLILKSAPNKPKLDNRPYIRLFTPRNKLKFSTELSVINWNDLFARGSSTNEYYNIFISKISEIYEKSFPLKQVSRKAYKNKPWFTRGLKVCSNNKNLLFRKWLRSQKEEDHKIYLTYKRIYQKVLKDATIKYYNDRFRSSTNNIKTLWKNLNELIGQKAKTKKSVSIEKLTIDGIDYLKPEDICLKLNNNDGQ